MADDVAAHSSSIAALPPTTVRQLGSTNVLRDPSSVVKELIDNALDARASAIFVDIAANTLDSIQVKDTGHGISAEDRALVCRRYCTSKIRDFRDLEDIGGKWLGFRGEALASMAEMSGTLEIITRVEGESVAFKLKYGRDGELISTEHASAPVGTTAKITNFFQNLPVRRETALKESAKVLSKIKHLMQSYAFARPSVRFSLRVLKAKSNKGDFVYAPKKDANIEDTALKVVGKSCALQCEWTALQSDGYDVRAFLPKPDADGSKVANEGAFLSIDGRPLSTGRGTPRKIVAAYKERLRKTNPNLRLVKDAFLCMYITCPPGSYDPNIEPSKDDVLFEREDIVLEVVTKLFTAHFPEVSVTTDVHTDPDPPTPAQKASTREPFSPLNIGINVAESDLSTRPGTTFSILEEATPTVVPNRTAEPPPIWRSNMYGIDEEDLELINSEAQPPVIEDEEEQRRAANVSNPWTIAKMSASIKSKKPVVNGQLVTPAKSQGDLVMSSSSPIRLNTRRQLPLEPHTPQTVSKHGVDSQSYHAGHHQSGEQSSPIRGLNCQISSQGNALTRDNRETQNPTLDMRLDGNFSSPFGPQHIERSEQPNGEQKASYAPKCRPNKDGGYSGPSRAPAPFRPPRPKRTIRRPELDPLVFDCDEPAQTLNSRNNTDIRDFLGRGRPQLHQHTSQESIITSSPSAVVRRPFKPHRVVNREYSSHTRDPDLAFPRSIPRASSAEPLHQRGRHRNNAQYIPDHCDEPSPVHNTNTFSRHDAPSHVRTRARSVDSQPVPTPSRPRTRTTDLEMNAMFATYSGSTPLPIASQRPNNAPPPELIPRRPITRLHRRRSSRLPLEQVPQPYRLHNVVLHLKTTPTQLAASIQKLDMQLNSLAWRCPANEPSINALSAKVPDHILRAWVIRLDAMLEHFDTQLDNKAVMLTLERGIAAALGERQIERDDGLASSSDVQRDEVVQPEEHECMDAMDQIREWAMKVSPEGEGGGASPVLQGVEPVSQEGKGYVGDEYGGEDLDDEMLMDI